MDGPTIRSNLKGLARVIAEDLERRKRLERSLAESQFRYKSLVESVGDWIWEVDAAGRYVYASPQVKQILGYEPEEMIGKTPFDFMPPHEAQRVTRLFNEFLERSMPFNGLENENFHRDGSIVCLETSGTPIFDGNRRLVGYRGIDRDISARRKAEDILLNAKQALEHEVRARTRKLRQANTSLIEEIEKKQALTRELAHSNERYRMLLLASPEPIVVYDSKGCISLVNEAFVKTFGWTEQECIGARGDSVPKSTGDWLLQIRKRSLAGKRIQFLETRLGTKGGQTLDCQISSAPIMGPGKKPMENILIIRDVTRFKENEFQLREQSRHLEEANTTLRVLLEKGNREREDIEERILANVRKLILPYFKKVRRSPLDDSQRHYLELLEANLLKITSPFSDRLSKRYAGLTATEIKVADLVRHGKNSHEISLLLGVSAKTVAIHRGNIRRKLGLRNTRDNLRSYLLSLQ